jgi:spore coat protein A
MTSRREFVKFTGVVGAGLLLPGLIYKRRALAQINPHPHPTTFRAVLRDPGNLAKYVDALPFPVPVLKPVGKRSGADYFEVAMTQFTQQLHRDLPETTLWGYGDARSKQGSYPGPTFEVRKKKRILVKWINRIENDHYLIPGVFDPSLHGTDMGEPPIKTVVHLHGGHVPPDADGLPEAWFTPNFAQKGPDWTREIYDYPNLQDAASLWYHDHAIGQTRLNVYAGLAGLFLLRDDFEDKLKIPSGNYEVPLVIQDRVFDVDGFLAYPVSPLQGQPDHPGPWIPEFFGDTLLVNGKVWPFFEVEPRRYRFRIYNGSNARFYRLFFEPGLPFFQLAAEQGFFDAPVKLDSIVLAPAERADVIVDFSAHFGQTLLLRNDANSPFPNGDPVDENTNQVLQFRVVKPLNGKDTSEIPDKLRKVKRLKEAGARVRYMPLIEHLDADDNPIIVLLNNKKWTDPNVDKLQLGKREIWHLINTTGDTHPIHLHLVRFQVLSRQAFNAEAYLTAWGALQQGIGKGPNPIDPAPFLTGVPLTPDANERGWKDTVRANPGEVTRIIAKFDDFTGAYPWHCHIIEHEDNEMMLPFEVIKGKEPLDPEDQFSSALSE